MTPSGGTCTTPNYYSNDYYRWLSPASPTRGQPGLDTPDIITVTLIAKYWTNDTRHSDIWIAYVMRKSRWYYVTIHILWYLATIQYIAIYCNSIVATSPPIPIAIPFSSPPSIQYYCNTYCNILQYNILFPISGLSRLHGKIYVAACCMFYVLLIINISMK